MLKIKNLALSLQHILVDWGVGRNPKRFYNKPSEDYSFKKNHILHHCGQNHIADSVKQVQNSTFSTKLMQITGKSPTSSLFLSTSFSTWKKTKYTGTIYASSFLHFRGDRSPRKCTNRSPVLIKTEAFGKFQLRSRLRREPP